MIAVHVSHCWREILPFKNVPIVCSMLCFASAKPERLMKNSLFFALPSFPFRGSSYIRPAVDCDNRSYHFLSHLLPFIHCSCFYLIILQSEWTASRVSLCFLFLFHLSPSPCSSSTSYHVFRVANNGPLSPHDPTCVITKACADQNTWKQIGKTSCHIDHETHRERQCVCVAASCLLEGHACTCATHISYLPTILPSNLRCYSFVVTVSLFF